MFSRIEKREKGMEVECLREVERAFKIAEKHYGRSIKRVPVTFSKRMTSSAGAALEEKNKAGKWEGTEIRLSLPLLKLNGLAFVSRTPGHEAAHIITTAIYGDVKTHGWQWQKVMDLIGIPAGTTHDYKIEKKAKRLFKYTRNGVTHNLTIIRHNKLQRGKIHFYQWKDESMVFKNDFVKEITRV